VYVEIADLTDSLPATGKSGDMSARCVREITFTVGSARIGVASASDAVLAWCSEYLGALWPATGEPSAGRPDRVVSAEVDAAQFAELRAEVLAEPADRFEYLRRSVRRRVLANGDRIAVTERDQVAYRVAGAAGEIRVVGADPDQVRQWTSRLVREAARAVLEQAGWALAHASAVVRDGRTILTLGNKGAGKTTTAMLLAYHRGWSLLSNDRVFVRPTGTGVDVLPWPAAAAVGLGLLDTLGLLDVVRARLRAGDLLHDITSPLVTEAILRGQADPLRDRDGRELKAQIMPRQLTDWFGIRHAPRGQVTLLFQPTLRSDAPTPAGPIRTARPALANQDFFWPTDDLFPDFLQLAVASPSRRREAYAAVRASLGDHPGATGALTHDPAANVRLLDGLVSELLEAGV
jgi:hypothetical protein